MTALAYPANGRPFELTIPTTTIRSVRFAFVPEAGTTGMFMGFLRNTAGNSPAWIHNGSTDPVPYGISEFLQSSGGNAQPGRLHEYVITSSPANGQRLYLDGVLVDTDIGEDWVADFIQLGYPAQPRGLTLCHFAVYDVILTPTQIALQAEAALTGFAGDRTDERVVRILGWAGVASSEVSVETGVETMTYQLTSGQSIVEALRDVESTEGGVLFDGRDGLVTFHNRAHRYLAPVAATFDMSAQHVGSDYRPKMDRSTLANDATAENPTTGETARLVDATSRDEYGVATSSVRVFADSITPLADRVAWLTTSYAEPRTRVPSLTVDVLAHVGLTPSATTILGLTVGDRIRVTNQPTQSDSTTVDYFIEGYSEDIGPETYQITFNLSPVYPAGNVLILDHAERAGLDEGNVAGL